MDDGGGVRKLPPWLWDIVRPALIAMIVALLVSLGVPKMPSPVSVQGVTHFSSVYSSGDVEAVDDLIAGDDVAVGGDLAVTGSTSLAALSASGTITASGVISASEDVEHRWLPCVMTEAVTYSSKSGLWTIGDGEIWVIYDVLVNVTTNYDCTGDDCTFHIGDGNDANGLVDLVDAELQAADTEGTGFAAGWQGQLAATKGAYLADGSFVYAPSGADETIDLTIGGTSPAGGAAEVTLIYWRVQ